MIGKPPGYIEVLVCWNCHQQLPVGTKHCLWCGAQQPDAEPAAAAPQPLAQENYAPQQPPAEQYAGYAQPAYPQQSYYADQQQYGQAVAPQQPWPGAVAPQVAPMRGVQRVLDSRFAGGVAGTGAQIAAFTIDFLIVLGITAAVFLLTRSLVFGALAFVESTVALWLLMARAGVTPGSGILRLRVARDDAPYSPGAGRTFVRGFFTGLAFLVGAVGAWILVGTSAADARGRSWADKAAGTQMVAVPPRSRIRVPQQQAAQEYTVPAQGIGQAPSVIAAPLVVSTAVRSPIEDIEDSQSQQQVTGPAVQFSREAVEFVAPESTVRGVNIREAESVEVADGTLLLVFDTGQREQLATPVAINLGRKPSPTEPTDKLIVVEDPDSTVSRTHLRIEHSRGHTWLTDGGATNGTDILEEDGEVVPLAAGIRTLLGEGARVRMGNRVFTISVLVGGDN